MNRHRAVDLVPMGDFAREKHAFLHRDLGAGNAPSVCFRAEGVDCAPLTTNNRNRPR
jgi:hypothetical protein